MVDVVDGEPLQRDVPEVRDEVVFDVRGVAAAGVAVHLAAGEPPVQVLPGGDVGARGDPGAGAPGDRVTVGQRLAGARAGEEGGDLVGDGVVACGEAEQGAGLVAFGDRRLAGVVAGVGDAP